ncbi:LysR family transcriptional regulator [Yinghuangia seranimata]|uniref:LysR family transcriptional regulator n=1 Tax=Yinghuangia seranimata TaxID=408067 RepID=UPI00248AD01A|nr:LysR family transcriptional regulator [Yinghuangia seranimata]MDI2124852.1 LysR family transcriptional regulator [Yinghuangia seranimata]
MNEDRQDRQDRQDPLNGVDLRHLRYLAAVADAGTVTAAAECLRIAQPSLSQQIRALERRVGVPLFHRRPHGMEPTEAGERLLHGARRAFAELETALAAARGVPSEPTLGVSPGVPEPVLAAATALITADGQARPRITPLTTRNQIHMLRTGDLAYGILRLPCDATGLALHLLSDESLGAVLPTTHPLAAHPTLTWTDLTDQRLLWFPTANAPEFAATVLDTLATNGWTPDLITEPPGSHAQFRLTLRTTPNLIALRPAPSIADDPTLTWRPITPNPPHERLALATAHHTPWAQTLPTAP